MHKFLLILLLVAKTSLLLIKSKCFCDGECDVTWPEAICRNNRCVCPDNSIRKKSDSYGWICLSLLDASTGMLGPPLTCPLPQGAGFRTVLNKKASSICSSKYKNSCDDGYECIQGIGFASAHGDGICCPTRGNACSQPVIQSSDGWIVRWYFNGTACISFRWNPEKNSTANNFTTKVHCESYCMNYNPIQ